MNRRICFTGPRSTPRRADVLNSPSLPIFRTWITKCPSGFSNQSVVFRVQYVGRSIWPVRCTRRGILTSHQPSDSRPASAVGSFANDASATVIGRRSVPKKTRTVVVFVVGSGGGVAFCPGDGFGGGGGGASAGGVGGGVSGGSAPAVVGRAEPTLVAGGGDCGRPHAPSTMHKPARTQSVNLFMNRSRTM